MAKLPPDIDGQNNDRARWAHKALQAFMKETGVEFEVDALSDLLADLMHWCDRNQTDFDTELARGRYHYAAETGQVQDA